MATQVEKQIWFLGQVWLIFGCMASSMSYAVATYAEEIIKIDISPESESVLTMEVHQEILVVSNDNMVVRHSGGYSQDVFILENESNDWFQCPKFTRLSDSVLPICFGIVSAYVLYIMACIFFKGEKKERSIMSENPGLEKLLMDHNFDDKVPDQLRSMYDPETSFPVTPFDKVSLIVLQQETLVGGEELEKVPIPEELYVSVPVCESEDLPSVHGKRPVSD